MFTAVTALVMGLGTASAFAAAAISVEPSEGLSATEPTTVAVTGSEFEASTEYRIGLCSTETYGFFGIPACGATVEVTSDELGDFGTEVEVAKETFNIHSGLPEPLNIGQPETFVCAGDPEEDDECELTVTFHNGLSSEVVATEAVTFE